MQRLTGVDTNVLIRAFAPVEDPQKIMARAFLRTLKPHAPGFVTQLSLAEFYFTMMRSYKIPRHDCLHLIGQLLKSPVLEFEDGESIEYALDHAHEGADFPDALIEQTHRLFGVERTVTFDKRATNKLRWDLLG